MVQGLPVAHPIAALCDYQIAFYMFTNFDHFYDAQEILYFANKYSSIYQKGIGISTGVTEIYFIVFALVSLINATFETVDSSSLNELKKDKESISNYGYV